MTAPTAPQGMNWTKGPWIAETHEKAGSVAVLGYRGDGDVRAVDGRGELFSIYCATREDRDKVMFPAMQPELVAAGHVAAAAPELYAALERLAHVINAAGIYNLSNGVQLGQVSWSVKANDAMEAAWCALALARGEATPNERKVVL